MNMNKSGSTASMEVEVQLRDFLDDRWRSTDARAEVFALLPHAVVSLAVETFDGEGYDPPIIDYYLIIGPKYEEQFPVTMLVSIPDVSYSVIAEWDGYDIGTQKNEDDNSPGDILSDALFQDGDAVLSALIGTSGGSLSIRKPVGATSHA
jgi:hypothetical protein